MERPLFHLCEIFRDCVECSYCDVTIASLFLKKLSPNVRGTQSGVVVSCQSQAARFRDVKDL